MGYNTRYELKVTGGDDLAIIHELRSEYDEAAHALEGDGDTLESCKWYSALEDLANFSKKHKNVLFQLKGNGEESPDLWVAYFINGVMQKHKAVITYPEFDPKTLGDSNDQVQR